MDCCAKSQEHIWDPIDFETPTPMQSGRLSPMSHPRAFSDPRKRHKYDGGSSGSGCNFLTNRADPGASAARLILEELKVLQASQVRVEGFLSKWIERQDALSLQLAEQQARIDCGVLAATAPDIQPKKHEEVRSVSEKHAHFTSPREPKIEDKERRNSNPRVSYKDYVERLAERCSTESQKRLSLHSCATQCTEITMPGESPRALITTAHTSDGGAPNLGDPVEAAVSRQSLHNGRVQYLKKDRFKQSLLAGGNTFMKQGDGHGIPVLNPSGYFMQWWQPMFLLALSFALLSAPFDMAYFWWTAPGFYKVVGKGVDVFFVLDVILHFNVAIIHHGKPVTSRKVIAVHYAKTTLVLDIISNIPYDWFLGSEGKGRKLIKLVKFPKLLRFIRLLKMLKEAKAVGVLPTLASIMLLAHYFSCLWSFIFLGDCDETSQGCPSPGATYLEGFSVSLSGFAGSDSWVRLLENPDTSHLFSTAKEGRGLRPLDEFVAVLMILTGFFLLAALFGNVASSIQGKNGAAVHHKMLLDTRKLEMEAAHIPKELQAKVEKTYEYLQRFGGSRDGMIRDETLSLDLRRSLASAIYGPTLRKVPLFANIDEVFLRILAQRIEMRLYTPGDFLIMKGEVGYELFMVFSGQVQVVDENKRVLLDGLCEGSYFGEVCFLQPGTRRSASVLCKEFCRTMVLTLSVFEELNLTSVLDEIREETARQQLHQADDDQPPLRQESPHAH